MKIDFKQISNFKIKSGFTLAEVFSVHLKGGRKQAFTLAEVLITLGIIGVVAAMTLPTLITKYQRYADKIALKKAYSVLSQAFENIKQDEHEAFIMDCPVGRSKCLGDYFSKYIKFVKTSVGNYDFIKSDGCWFAHAKGEQDYQYHYCAITADGLAFDFDIEYVYSSGDNCVTNGPDMPCATILVDTNGSKKPNTWGRDVFEFEIVYENGFKFVPNKPDSRTTTSPSNYCNYGKKGKNAPHQNRFCAYFILSGQ